MPEFDEAFYKTHIEAILTKLVDCGWIEGFGFNRAGGYALKWTPKGLERSQWVKLIESELDLGPKGMTALMVVCHMHAPNENPSADG